MARVIDNDKQVVVDGALKLTMVVLETDNDPQVHDGDNYIRTLLSLLKNGDVQPVDNDNIPQWRVPGTGNDLQMLDNNCRKTWQIDKYNDITIESDVLSLLMKVIISDNDP